MNQTALVLGGTGFVGAHIAETLAHNGYHVTTVSRSAAPHPHLMCALNIVEPATLAELIGPRDLVVNAAGGYWGFDEPQLHTSFVTVTDTVLAALRLIPAPRRPRYVHLGSVMEYEPTPEGTCVTEATPELPESGYGRTKLAASRLVRRACAEDGLDAVLLRATNSVGPGAHHGSLLGKVATALADAARRGGCAEIALSPLQASRDYLDVRDLGDAVLAAATADASGAVVNIGRGEALPVRDLVARLIAVSGVPAEVTETATAPRAPGSASVWLQVDTSTAARLLSWKASRSVDEALTDFWLDIRDSRH